MSILNENDGLFGNLDLDKDLKNFYQNSISLSNSLSNSFSKNFSKTFLNNGIKIFHQKVNLLNLIIFCVKNVKQFQK